MPPDAIDGYRIIGTAGHIDHGKSALVRALTGIDPDRLQEEKERGITIDLGFADARLDDLHVGFVDVPGHERFVKNMLAGVGGIDAVLMVVAADESIMPQTREHFAICQLLGIEAGVVALTKCDLVDDEMIELAELEVEELLADTPLAGAPIVHTSTVTGAGMEDLRTALGRVLASTPTRPTAGVLRLPIDRIFTMTGFGTVVTGTLLAGSVAVGDQVEALPLGRTITVRGVQVHGREQDRAVAGQRTALNLQGVQVDELARGMVLGKPDTLQPTYMIDARLRVLDGFAVKHLQRLRFHHGAAEVLGRAAVLGADLIRGTEGYVQLRLESPYPAAPGDRFIVRHYSPVLTIGGGVVLDTAAPKRRRGRAAIEAMRRLDGADNESRLTLWIDEAGESGLERSAVRRRLACTDQVLDDAIAGPIAKGRIVEIGGHEPRLVPRAAIERLCAQALEILGHYHERYPLRPGLPKQELRNAVARRVPEPVFDAALARLIGDNSIRAAGDGFALQSHQVSVGDTDLALRDELLGRFKAQGVAVAAPSDVLATVPGDANAVGELFHHLLRDGRLVRIREGFVVDAGALRDLIADLQTRLPAGARFSVADFKTWTGLTRKHSIPLLEYLDSTRVTRRVGDERERI
ncbi:MAG TPA: selenocysteine-specific translation elongation factor [Acidobacteriota bacterium]|nr:selenocysteine-specific translation elongation factor [Acidobacteriota bacterium]